MVKSMTGFGRGVGQNATHAITVEVSTVNRKQFDATLWLPREWQRFEVRILGLLQKTIARGAVKLSVTVTPLEAAETSSALVSHLERLRALAKTVGIQGAFTLSDLLALPSEVTQAELPAPSDELYATLSAAVSEAVENLQKMRLHEGERMAQDIRERFSRLHVLYTDIQQIAPTLPPLYRDALNKRIADLLPEGLTLDANQLAREVALFADRCDIAEELTRLQAHFDHAETLLTSDTPCGRSMDFLCQEFFREINTTGSKCNNANIARKVIDFKTLLETIREQVQNLE